MKNTGVFSIRRRQSGGTAALKWTPNACEDLGGPCSGSIAGHVGQVVYVARVGHPARMFISGVLFGGWSLRVRGVQHSYCPVL